MPFSRNPAQHKHRYLAVGAVSLGLILLAGVFYAGPIGEALSQLRKDASAASVLANKRGTVQPAVESVRVELADGSFLTLDNLPASLSQNIQRVGVDGTTEASAQTLAQLAQQLMERGETETANELKTLSNSIYQLASHQRAVNGFLSLSNPTEPPDASFKQVLRDHSAWLAECEIGSPGCVTHQDVQHFFQTPQSQKLASAFFSDMEESQELGSGVEFVKVSVNYIHLTQNPFLQKNPAVHELVDTLVDQTRLTHFVFSSALCKVSRMDSLPISHIQDHVIEHIQEHEAQRTAQSPTTCTDESGVRLLNGQCHLNNDLAIQ
jgi:hypothetical protein